MSIVSVKVQAESPEIAENLAESFLSRLENVFAFSLFNIQNDLVLYYVSVFGQPPIRTNSYLVLSQDSGDRQHWALEGIYRSIELSKLLKLDARYFSKHVEKISGKDLTKMEKRLSLAVDFCGLAIRSIGQPSSFVQAVTALECLFSMGRANIESSVSDHYAFILGRSLEERLELKKKIRRLYDIRSDLAHGARSTIKKSDCREAIACAQNAIFAFLFDDKLSGIIDEKSFKEYIDTLKFDVGEGNKNI